MKNFKLPLFTLLICLFSFNVFNAQTIFSKVSVLAGSSDNLSEATSMVNSNNEIVSVGSVLDNTSNISRAYFAKYDLNGDFLGGNIFSLGTDNIRFTEVKQYGNGDYLVAGVRDYVSASVFFYEVITVRLDASGNIIWSKSFPISTRDIGISSFSKQGVVLSGDTAFVAYAANNNMSADVQFGLIKMNAVGDTLWTKTAGYGISQFPSASLLLSNLSDLIMLSDGNLLMVGKIWEQGSFDLLILHYFNQNGGYIQSKEIDFSGSVSVDVTKVRENSLTDLVFYGRGVGGTAYGGMTFKTNLFGTFMSGKIINDQGQFSIGKETQDGGMIIGTTNSYAADASYPKIALHKYDATGNLEWNRAYGGQNGDNLRNILEFSNGNYIITGSTGSFSSVYGEKLYMNGIDSMGVTAKCQRDIIDPTTEVITAIDNFITPDLDNIWDFSTISLSQQALSLTVSDIGYTIEDTIIEPLCNGDNGMIDITVVGAQQPITYIWSNGTIAEDLTGVSGTYNVEVKDGFQCFNSKTITLTEPTVLQATYTATNVDCFGAANGAIDVTASGGIPGYNYSWSTLATSEDLSNISGGFYQVTIKDTNNCSTVLGIAVTEPQQLSAIITNTINASCYTYCDGELAGFAAGGTSPYNYTWNDPSSQTNDTATGLCYGNYLLTVTDANGCLSYSNATVSEPIELTNTITEWETDCFAANGGAITTPSGGTTPYTYSWDGGATTTNDSVGGLDVGIYALDITDANGCYLSDNFMINSNTAPVEICVVTVDSATGKNMIVWTKPAAQNIQGFYIYRNIAGVYSQVGYQPYDSISEYVDNSFGVDPMITSYRYEISVLDSCGNESLMSNFHETIHLTSNLGLSGEVNLIWDSYEGFVFTQYNILRDSTGTGDWELINQVGSSSFTYSDQNPPQTSTLKYMVEVVLPATCSATKAIDHNTTRSNRATAVDGSGNATSITELILSEAKIYPNPNNGIFTVQLQSDNWEYALFDMSGKLISTEQITENNATVNIQDLETGIYLMKINLRDSFVYKKIVKQ